ncbi:MAG: aminoglycoside phosphotransferase family protein [Gammaproteobacteria bacterium]|nr:aminoglycoside phosphotransferase family protein [Gammaproteobacteria bacterium]
MTAITRQIIRAALEETDLISEHENIRLTPMTGGVSSEIWKVTAGERTFCVKRALDRLKVEAEWFAPVERSLFEVRWYGIAGRVAPGSAPVVRWHDDERMFFIMDYLDPGCYELWKEKLRQGRAETVDAENVGWTLARIHSATAGDPSVAAQFPRTDIFHDIRLEPYLLATAARHPDLRARLEALCRTTAETRLTMIHGDVSPKNILIGPDGPVFLDAECACIGDPAFDLAFCLNHMLLKCLWNPPAKDDYLACFQALAGTYVNGVDWEDQRGLEARTAALLPALFLARVDGKSPVEYITDEADREKVRRVSRALLEAAPACLNAIQDAWRMELAG